MSTRCYVMPSTAAAVSPSFSAGWNKTSDTLRRRMPFSRQNSANSSNTSNGDGTANHNILIYQLVSDPIGSQAISGTVKGQFLVQEGSAGLDCSSAIRIFVVSNDGSTVRGVLLELDNAALSSEWVVGTNTNRKFPLATLSPASLSSVNAHVGDRIVVEIGGRVHSTVATAVTVLLRDNSATDLPEDETTTAGNNSWIEFSQTLVTGYVGTGTGAASGSASLSSAGMKAGRGTGTVSDTPGASVAGRKQGTTTGSVSLTPGATVAGAKVGLGAGALTDAPTFDTSWTTERTGSDELDATLTFDAAGEGQHAQSESGSGSLTLTAILSRAAQKRGAGASTLTRTPSFSVTGQAKQKGAASLGLPMSFGRTATKEGKAAGSIIGLVGGSASGITGRHGSVMATLAAAFGYGALTHRQGAGALTDTADGGARGGPYTLASAGVSLEDAARAAVSVEPLPSASVTPRSTARGVVQ